jgi:hypothetical protein
MVSVLTTTDRGRPWNGASWSALVAPSNGPLTAWTPTTTQSGTVAFTTTVGTQSRVGRRIFFEGSFAITGTGTGSDVITVSLPVTAAASSAHVTIGTALGTTSQRRR